MRLKSDSNFQGRIKEVINGETGHFNDEVMDGGSFLLLNIDYMSPIDMSVMKKLLEQESNDQNPELNGEPMHVPTQRTVAILNRQKHDLDKIEEMDRRAREYCAERQIVKQVKRFINARMHNDHSQND